MQPSVGTEDSLLGTTLAGRYLIEARVGTGAMGAVYRAQQAGLGRAVALKVLRRDVSAGSDTVQRFRREAQAMSQLSHPNTVRVFDFGATDDGLLYLAMELLEGEPMTDRLAREGRLRVTDAVSYTQQVLRSVGEAHKKGIVHRDLKPDNVFLARVAGQPAPLVKVLDFGIAKSIAADRKIDQFETLDGTVFGTPRYMSPEQAGGRALDARSDLYAVGIMLYEFLTGSTPFVDADAVVVMAKHIREQPAAIGKRAPDRAFPKRLQAVVSRALQKSPEKRFQSAEAFEQALAGCLRQAAMLDRLSGDQRRAAAFTRVLAARPWLAAGVASAALAALALASWPDGGEPPRAENDIVELTTPAPRSLPALAAAPTVPARSAVVAPARGVVLVSSEPHGAAVFRDGVRLGVTPLEVVVEGDATTTLELRKDGYMNQALGVRATDTRASISLTKARPKEPARRTRRVRAPAVRRKPSAAPAPAPPAPAQPAPASPYEKF